MIKQLIKKKVVKWINYGKTDVSFASSVVEKKKLIVLYRKKKTVSSICHMKLLPVVHPQDLHAAAGLLPSSWPHLLRVWEELTPPGRRSSGSMATPLIVNIWEVLAVPERSAVISRSASEEISVCQTSGGCRGEGRGAEGGGHDLRAFLEWGSGGWMAVGGIISGQK